MSQETPALFIRAGAKVYISAPQGYNRQLTDAANKIQHAGFVPVSSLRLHQMIPSAIKNNQAECLRIYLRELTFCDCLYIVGPADSSRKVRAELNLAIAIGMPIFFDSLTS